MVIIDTTECMDCLYFNSDDCPGGECTLWDDEDYVLENEDDTPYCIEYQEWVRPQKKIPLTFSY